MAILKALAAVVAGIAIYSLLLFGVTMAGEAWLGRSEREFLNTSVATQVGWLAWNIVSMAVAGYVAARIARMPGALAMGTVQALFTLGAMFTDHVGVTPRWLWIAVIVTTIPAAWLGARLRTARGLAAIS